MIQRFDVLNLSTVFIVLMICYDKIIDDIQAIAVLSARLYYLLVLVCKDKLEYEFACTIREHACRD